MKNWLKILIIATLFINSFGFGFRASAQISAYNIQVEDIKNGYATLKWRTNEAVKSEIYYGLDTQNLNKKWSNNNYKRNHQANLYGLEEDKDYYYQITLYSRSGEKLEIYTRSFSTDDMEDTVAPRFLEADIIQTIGNTVALSWEANEKVKTEIHYWKKDDYSHKKVKKINSYKIYQEYFLYNLDEYSKYYIRVVIKDKAGNKRSKTFKANIYEEFDRDSELKIRNIKPLNSNTDLISDKQITIKFKSNLAAKSYIKYGTSPNKLSNKVYINDKKRTTNHEVTIEGLNPNTAYYYNIYAGEAIYRKKTSVKGLSFVTKGEVLGVKETAERLDSDHDQLSNALEMAIGTDPYDPDTDNDGYRDGTEIKNGYNPLGPGKWNNEIEFFYGKPRIDLAHEQIKAIELKEALDKKIKYIYISPQTWHMLVNAYVYGDYPSGAIIMYVKLNGQTVHPDINWHTWKDSPDYLKYEKYIK